MRHSFILSVGFLLCNFLQEEQKLMPDESIDMDIMNLLEKWLCLTALAGSVTGCLYEHI